MAVSRDIERYRTFEDCPTTDPVGATLDGTLAYEIDVAAQQLTQLLAHGLVVKQASARIGLEIHQDVDVALGRKVGP